MVAINRKERDRQQCRADILKAAEHQFAIKGYHNATVRTIAHEAQYAVGTVYLYFKDKDDLYFALLEDKIGCLVTSAKEETEKVTGIRKKLQIFIREGLIYFEGNQDFFRIFISDNGQTDMDQRMLKSKVGAQHQSYLISLIRQAQKEHLIYKGYDPTVLVEIFTSILKAVILDWFAKNPKSRGQLKEKTDLILDLFLTGASKH